MDAAVLSTRGLMSIGQKSASQPRRLARRAGFAARNGLALWAGLAAGLPIVVATVHGVLVGWLPVGDDGLIAARSYDVFTSDTPLVGIYSAAPVAGPPLHKPGPMLFWLLAAPAHLLPAVTLSVLMGIVNSLSVIGVVALARRRGGLPLMFATAAGIALMLASLGGETLHDIWNPSAGLLPFGLLLFLCWSVASGEYRLLPVTTLVASFVIQTHLTFLLPSVGLSLVAVIGLVVSRKRSPTGGRRGDGRRGQDPQASPSLGRFAGGALVVALGCWSFPLLDEAIHHPGNLTLLLRATLHRWPTLGASSGWHAVVRAIGVPAWWFRGPQSWTTRIHELVTPPSTFAAVSALVVLVGLATVGVLGWRRRRHDVAFVGVAGLVLSASLFEVVASGPTTGASVLTNGYISLWASPAGMWIWLALGWALVELLAPAHGWSTIPLKLSATTAVLCVVLVLGAVEAAREHSEPGFSFYSSVRAITGRFNAPVVGSGHCPRAHLPVRPSGVHRLRAARWCHLLPAARRRHRRNGSRERADRVLRHHVSAEGAGHGHRDLALPDMTMSTGQRLPRPGPAGMRDETSPEIDMILANSWSRAPGSP